MTKTASQKMRIALAKGVQPKTEEKKIARESKRAAMRTQFFTGGRIDMGETHQEPTNPNYHPKPVPIGGGHRGGFGFGGIDVDVPPGMNVPKPGGSIAIVSGRREEKKKKKKETGILDKMGQFAKDEASNAVAYWLGVENPPIPGLRVPDGTGQPSLTSQMVQRIEVKMWTIEETKGQFRKIGGLWLYPNLSVGIFQVGSASTALDNLVWEASSYSELSNFSDVAAMYRAVSMGVSLTDTGALLERGVRMFCGNVPAYGAGVNVAADPLGLLENVPFSCMDSAVCGNSCAMFWVPQSGLADDVGVFDSVDGVGFNGRSWRTPGTPVSSTTPNFRLNDSSILALFYTGLSAEAPVATDNIQAQLYLNVEYQPYPGDRFIGTPSLVVGDLEDVAKAQSLMHPPVATEGAGVSTSFFDNLLDASKSALGVGIKQLATEAAGFVSDVFGPMLFGKGKKLLELHKMAIKLGRPDLSPLGDGPKCVVVRKFYRHLLDHDQELCSDEYLINFVTKVTLESSDFDVTPPPSTTSRLSLPPLKTEGKFSK